MAVGKSGHMIGPQLTVPLLTTDSNGVHTDGMPSLGMSSSSETGRKGGVGSEAAQGTQVTPGSEGGVETSFPITVGGHVGPLGGELGIDLAPIPDALRSGAAALEDGFNFLGQKALEHLGITPSGPDPANPDGRFNNGPQAKTD